MEKRPHLKRALGLYATTSIVIGSVVGSGIFKAPGDMARHLPSAPWLLGVWLFAGLLTLFGAFTQCELVAQMPKTGGLYQYFHEVYGERTGFLYGWANFMIAGSGAIAYISMVFSDYFGHFVTLPHLSDQLEQTALHLGFLGDLFPLKDIGNKLIAVFVVFVLTTLNVRGVKLGGTLQSISTTSKMLAIAAIVLVAFIAGSHVGSTANWSMVGPVGDSLSGWKLAGAFSIALTGAFWTYDGWGNVAYVAGEVREPSRTIPRAIILGTLTFMALYMIVNLAYIYILGVGGIANAPGDRIATQMISNVIGSGGAGIIAVLIMLSTFDTTNSTILTNARVYFAMARKRLFYHRTAHVHPRFQTPHVALILQGVWACILLVTGSYGILLDMYVFVNWMLYVLMGVAVFVLRKRHPQAERPFKVPGYPIVPGIFVLFATAYVVLTLVTDIQAFRAGEEAFLSSVTGILLVLTGLPLYYFWKSRRGIDDPVDLATAE